MADQKVLQSRKVVSAAVRSEAVVLLLLINYLLSLTMFGGVLYLVSV